ncbi:hypothetical protein P8452_51688 [Trifolium repens]|nr:hypothetical protein P8452_51688 [Trifolium repens]
MWWLNTASTAPTTISSGGGGRRFVVVYIGAMLRRRSCWRWVLCWLHDGLGGGRYGDRCLLHRRIWQWVLELGSGDGV